MCRGINGSNFVTLLTSTFYYGGYGIDRVSRNRPSTPRYSCIWDVDVVLNMFRKQPLAEYLSNVANCHAASLSISTARTIYPLVGHGCYDKD